MLFGQLHVVSWPEPQRIHHKMLVNLKNRTVRLQFTKTPKRKLYGLISLYQYDGYRKMMTEKNKTNSSSRDPKPPPRLSNIVVVLQWLGRVWLPRELAHWCVYWWFYCWRKEQDDCRGKQGYSVSSDSVKFVKLHHGAMTLLLVGPF